MSLDASHKKSCLLFPLKDLTERHKAKYEDPNNLIFTPLRELLETARLTKPTGSEEERTRRRKIPQTVRIHEKFYRITLQELYRIIEMKKDLLRQFKENGGV